MNVEIVKQQIKELILKKEKLEKKLIDEKVCNMIKTKALTEDYWSVVTLSPDIKLHSFCFKNKKLSDIFCPDAYGIKSDLFIFDNCNLRFSYSDIWLSFNNMIDATTFIRKYRLLINTDSLKETIKKAETFMNTI